MWPELLKLGSAIGAAVIAYLVGRGMERSKQKHELAMDRCKRLRDVADRERTAIEAPVAVVAEAYRVTHLKAWADSDQRSSLGGKSLSALTHGRGTMLMNGTKELAFAYDTFVDSFAACVFSEDADDVDPRTALVGAYLDFGEALRVFVDGTRDPAPEEGAKAKERRSAKALPAPKPELEAVLLEKPDPRVRPAGNEAAAPKRKARAAPTRGKGKSKGKSKDKLTT